MGIHILITGGAGTIGTALGWALERRGFRVTALDLRASGEGRGDVCDAAAVRRAMGDCSGVVHLAAVSRVAWGERDPRACQSTNVGGTRTVLSVAREVEHRPWVLFASSREVYGEPDAIPVTEDMQIRPVNAYGRSKAEAEALVGEAVGGGLQAAVVRLSNVYGGPHDHADRVVPSFVRAALRGAPLDVAGTHRAFDFTHIDDVVRGLCAVIDLLQVNPSPPPVHLVTGAAVTLGELARAAVEMAGSGSVIQERPAPGFDVSRFVGDPRRARAVLGWEARISLRDGLERLIQKGRAEQGDRAAEVSAS